MRKKKLAVLLTLLAAAVLGICFLFLVQVKTVYLEENSKELDNPDRGYYVQVYVGEEGRFEELAQDGIRLALLALDLRKYSEQRITQEKLDELEKCLQNARKYHISIIFRAAYGFDGSCREPEKKGLIQEHITQIAEVLNQYTEQILCVQAGMLGPYGEWHHGEYLPDDDESKAGANRLFVLKAWEETLSTDMKVNVRRPRFIREAEEAGILAGRLGFHNDGLLGSDSDLGTYDDPSYDREKELEWSKEQLLLVPNGGEMPMVSKESSAENADSEFARLHVSYLNCMYNKEVIEAWENASLHGQNAEQYIENHLGYRLFVSRYKKNRRTEAATVTICNSGYAPLPQGYRIFLVTELDGKRYYQEVAGEELSQICNGDEVTLEMMRFPKANEEETDRKRLGIQITKAEAGAEARNCVELANDKIDYEDGVNYMFMDE